MKKKIALVLSFCTLVFIQQVYAQNAVSQDSYQLPESYYNSQKQNKKTTTIATNTNVVSVNDVQPEPTPQVTTPSSVSSQATDTTTDSTETSVEVIEPTEPTVSEPVTEPVVAASEEKKDEPLAGYDGGFFLKDREGKYRMDIWMRYQGRYSASFIEDADDAHSFLYRRWFLGFSGHVFTEKLTYGWMFCGGWRECWADVSYKFADELSISFFYDTVQFNESENVSSGKLQFVTKSLISGRFTPATSIGLRLSGTVGRFSYFADIFNGARTDTSVNANNELAYALKVSWNVFGSFSAGESDVAFSDKPAMVTKLAGVFYHEEADTQARVMAASWWLGFKWKGFSLIAEVDGRYTDPDQFTQEQMDFGYSIQSGFFVIPKRLEFAVRHTALLDDITDVGVNLNMATNDLARLGGTYAGGDVNGDSDNEYAFSGVINYYFNESYNWKIQTQYTLNIDGIPGADDIVNHIVMTQFQVNF